MKAFAALFLVAIVALAATPPALSQSATLRPGDQVEIRLGGVPAEFVNELTAQYQVDDQGNLNLPMISTVRVAGLTISGAQQAIEAKLRAEEIYTNPTIIITTQTTQRFVSVGGAVRAPGRIPYTADLTLSTAINAAGGLNEFGSPKRISLIRGGQRASYDLRKIAKDPSTDPTLLPGDQVEVGQSAW